MRKPNPTFVSTRADDDLLLNMLDMRRRKQSTTQIENITGIKREAVRTATNRVREADIAYEPEAAAWWAQ